MIGKLIATMMAFGCFIGPVFAKPFNHKFGELREYNRHWLAVCPNKSDPATSNQYDRTCWASTYSGDENGVVSGHFPGNRLSLAKDRFTGRFKISFVAKIEDEYIKGEKAFFRFSDGEIFPLTFGEDVITSGSVNEFTVVDEELTYDLIKRMRYGSHLVITMPGKDGPDRMQFSMMGLRKAMNFISIYGRK